MSFENLSKKLDKEERDGIKHRILSDAELLLGGSEIREDGSLKISQDQLEKIRNEEDYSIKKSDEAHIDTILEKLQEHTYAYKNPERLLDENYHLDALPEGGYRKYQLLRMKSYYDDVRKNIASAPLKLDFQEQKIVKMIEDLPIDDLEKIDLILVWRKLKPATDFNIDYPGSILWWLRKRKIEKVLDKLNMNHSTVFLKSYNAQSIAISPDKSTFNVMMGEKQRYLTYLERKKYDPNLPYEMDYEKAGMFYGFPETAIKAFVEEHLDGSKDQWRVDRRDLPEDIRKVATFIYSKDHWREEAKTSIRWAQEIQLASPKLYRECFHSRK